MDGIKIDVTGNIAKVTEKPRRITSGTIGLPVEFTFDDQWDGLSKKAVFRAGHFSITRDLNEEEHTVPWEVLVFPHMWLSIGVYGVNEGGTASIPTIWVNISVIQPGTVPDGASPAEPTPPVWQRIEDEVNRIGGVVDDVNNKYDGTQEAVEKLNDRVSDLEDVAPMIVTLDYEQEDGEDYTIYLASHSSEKIGERFLAGGAVIGKFYSRPYDLPLHSMNYHPEYGDVAVFVLHDTANRKDKYYYVTTNRYVYSEDIDCGGAEVMRVYFNEGEMTAN